MNEQSLISALAAWRDIGGRENVLTLDSSLNHYARTTLPKTVRPLAILMPTKTTDVQSIVKVASQYQIPLYPISRGKNWGYGSATPVTEGQVILDLSKMNKIIAVNKDLAYAVIEPGVTQEQLQRHLKDNGYDLWLDITGAGPEASIIGNTIERGFGHTPLADHFHTSCGYEVVLADGSVMTTGFGHYKNATTTYLFKTGIGPSLDGLFTQSNFGIVTKMGIWLMLKPEKLLAYFMTIPDDETLGLVIEALRPLRMKGILQSALHIGNDLRVISSAQAYPWEEAKGRVPLPDFLRIKLRKERGVDLWNAMGAFYGDADTVAAAKKSLRRALQGLVAPIFVDAARVRMAKIFLNVMPPLRWVKALKEKICRVETVFEPLHGTPTIDALKGVYWRTRSHQTLQEGDPDTGTTGLMWLSPVIPMDKNSLHHFLGLIEPTFKAHGFDSLITFTMLNARVLCGVLSVNFDKSDQEETDQAQKCYDALLKLVMENGYIPYRTSTQSMGEITDEHDPFWTFIQTLKKAADPQHILAPGRYNLPPVDR